MTPLLSMLASAKAFGLTAFRSLFEPQGAYDSLATITVASENVTSITFDNIPNDYKHLQIRAITRSSRTVGGLPFEENTLVFNTYVFAPNYSRHHIGGNGTNYYSEGYSSKEYTTGGFAASSTNVLNSFGTSIIDILDYSSTTKNKTVRVLSGVENNGSGSIMQSSGAWHLTDAITKITFTLSDQVNGSKYVQNTEFTLYGVK